MDASQAPVLAAVASAGLLAGLALLWRGFGSYRTAARISGIATSRISAMAAGEVRVSGIVEPAEVLLTSTLQSVPCVYYRSIVKARDEDSENTIHDEERAVGFRVRDASGEVRVFPRRSRWDVPARFEDRSSRDGSAAGLRIRTGSPFQMAEQDRETLIADLLTPRAPVDPSSPLAGVGDRTYVEARIEPGETVTVVGRALPFGQLGDPSEADVSGGDALPVDDPVVAMNIAEARAAGILVTDPALAWGNAAIPGFGIGTPVREPVLDAAADRPALASAEIAERVSRTFDIAPEQLVIAAGPDAPLLVASGPPGAAAARQQQTFLVGLLGAALAIGSAVVLAFAVGAGALP